MPAAPVVRAPAGATVVATAAAAATATIPVRVTARMSPTAFVLLSLCRILLLRTRSRVRELIE
ncbi:hypothetical protein GCM10010219_51030 [Streptomyces netropsis]|nr:hypothetical protein GCM10010219_51030 [Streptomyces netropsis]